MKLGTLMSEQQAELKAVEVLQELYAGVREQMRNGSSQKLSRVVAMTTEVPMPLGFVEGGTEMTSEKTPLAAARHV
jgi:hypothetical protein